MRMRIGKALIAALFVVVLVAGFSSAALSQDAAGDITCDSDLVLLWYMAERYFAFGAVQNAVAATAADPTTVVDLNRFNPGPFASLFSTLRGTIDPNTGMLPGTTLNQDWLNAVLTTMQMDATSFQDFLNSLPAGTAGLPMVSIAGEAPECTQLRGQLQRFFAAVVLQDAQTGLRDAVGLIANFNANVNVNANDNVDANVNANANDNADDNANANANDNTDDNANANTNDNSSGDGGSSDDNANANTNDNTDDNANVNDNTDDNANVNDNTDDNANDNDDDSGGDDGDNSGPGSGGDDDDDNSGSGSGGDDDNSGSGGGGGDDDNSGSGGGD